MAKGKKIPPTNETSILATASAATLWALFLTATHARGGDAPGAVQAPKWRTESGGSMGADFRRPRGSTIKVERGEGLPAGAPTTSPKKAGPSPREVVVGRTRGAHPVATEAPNKRTPQGASPRLQTAPDQTVGGKQGEGQGGETGAENGHIGGQDGNDALRDFLGHGGGTTASHDEGQYRELIFRCDGGIQVLPRWGARYGCVLGGIPADASVDVIPEGTSPNTCRADAVILPGGRAMGLVVAPTEVECAFRIELGTADGGGNLPNEDTRVLKRILINPRSED